MKHIIYIILLLSLTANINAQCIDGAHSPFQDQGWISCHTDNSPIPERGEGHWIYYDFGYHYAIDSLYIWNHNVWGETGMGAKTVLIDYSLDNENWTTAGPYTIERAPGSWKYTGDPGPVLNNAQCRYMVITVVDTWDEFSSCAGIGEIRFSLGEVTAVEDLSSDEDWMISPNPATHYITLHLENLKQISSITLYNNLGQKIADLTTSVSSKLQVPIDNLKSGMYFIAVRSESGITSKSFVKG